MRKLIVGISIFCLVLAGSYFFLVHKLSQGYVDRYYNKFTQEAGSLIIGLSRADQGIAPYILEKELTDYNIEKPLVNFATNQSSFGEVYLRAIQKKIKSTSNSAFFIIAVSPGSFTAPEGMTEQDICDLDKKTVMGKIDNFTSAPNYDYITNCYSQSLYNTFNSTRWKFHIPHSSGWNEIRSQNEFDSIKANDISHWKSLTLRNYNRKIKIERVSQYRIDNFISTIKYLKPMGRVFMVRLPADKDIIALENEKWKNFDQQFDSISKKYQIHYLNYSNVLSASEYRTYDGSHMVSKSAIAFTKKLSQDIKDHLANMQKSNYEF